MLQHLPKGQMGVTFDFTLDIPIAGQIPLITFSFNFS
jgi:hypothetical protein